MFAYIYRGGYSSPVLRKNLNDESAVRTSHSGKESPA